MTEKAIIFQYNRWLTYNQNEHSISPSIICVSGPIAGGKTYYAKLIAEGMKCKQVSVSDYLKNIAINNGMEDIQRTILQQIGEEQINLGWSEFCRRFLLFAEWNPSKTLIIDGIRHIEFVDSIKRICATPNVKIVFIDEDNKIITQRLEQRKEGVIDLSSSAEGNLEALYLNADVVIQPSLCDDTAALLTVVNNL